jgi:uncharacterized membrane protein YkvI
MFDYLYYKLYQASLKSSLKEVPHILAPVYFGGLISVNILVIYLFLVKIDALPFLFTDKRQGGVLTALIIVLTMLYYRKAKRTTLIDKYSQEDERERKRGNAIVAIYVAVSFLLIFAVAFFRPGKL